VRRTLLSPACRVAPADSTWLALVVAALWTWHPLQTESVTYVIQRAESLMGLFYLLTFWCFIRSVEPGASSRWALGAWVACLLGMLTKEVMVSAPLLVALYDRTFVAGSWREVWARRRGFYLALGGTWLALLGLVLSDTDKGGSTGFGMSGIPVSAYFFTQVQAIVHYLRLVFWPAPLILDYGGELVRDWTTVVWPGLLLVALGAASLRAAWRGRAAGFCGVLFFAVLAPTSSFMPLRQTMAEHRMYLPLAAVLVMIVLPVYRLAGRRGAAVLAVVALGLGALTERRNQDYATNIGIYEDTVAKRPGNARAMALLGDYYRRAGRLDDARLMLERSLQVEPGVPEVFNNLGNVWQSLGEPAKAVVSFEAALALRPRDLAAMNNLGNALILAGRVPEGVAQLEAALRLAPDSWQTRFNLATMLAQGGHLPEAAAQFERLLQLRPADAEIRAAYSDVLQGLGRKAEAFEQLQEASRLAPTDADLHNRLGTALGRAGRLREALLQFEEALRLDPAHPSAAQNAERARRLLGGG
jgi:Flp pilus assembly protein TadD